MEDFVGHLIVYFVSLFLAYGCARLFFWILLMETEVDEKMLRKKTSNVFEDFKGVMSFCKVGIFAAMIPFLNVFTTFIFMGLIIIMLLWVFSTNVNFFNWFPEDLKNKYKNK